MKKKGQIFQGMIIVGLMILTFILTSPRFIPIINEAATSVGGVPAFFMRLFPWIILTALIGLFLKIITSGGDFF